MKVRALQTIFYLDVRFRGDDTLGEGRGDILTLVDRDITEYDHEHSRPKYDENGKVKKTRLTAEAQFNPLAMDKMPDDTEDRITSAPEALAIANDDLAASKRSKQRARA